MATALSAAAISSSVCIRLKPSRTYGFRGGNRFVFINAFRFKKSTDLTMSELQDIGTNKIKSAQSGEEVELKSLWENQDCVITFFRRFGCGFCRLAAKDLSRIKPYLDEKNVKLIGIGVEDLGVEDFVKGEYFKGDLYVDSSKKCYQDLGYKRYNMLSLLPALATKTSRDAISRVRKEEVGGNMQGDKYQVGGTLVVTQGGEKVLLNHKQEALADHVSPSAVLKSLGIEANIGDMKNGDTPAQCNTETCEVSG